MSSKERRPAFLTIPLMDRKAAFADRWSGPSSPVTGSLDLALHCLFRASGAVSECRCRTAGSVSYGNQSWSWPYVMRFHSLFREPIPQFRTIIRSNLSDSMIKASTIIGKKNLLVEHHAVSLQPEVSKATIGVLPDHHVHAPIHS